MPFQLNLDVDKKNKEPPGALVWNQQYYYYSEREVDGFNIIIIIIHWFQHRP